MHKTYKAKSILNVHKHCDGGWFWTKYSASPYVGCQHGCEYCYSREEKYNHTISRDTETLSFSDAFSEYIKIKENAPELLRKELKSKPRDLIYLDSYQPVDAKYRFARKMLEVCLELGFPVFINEKSPLLLRDLDVIEKISKQSYLNVGWSIISITDDRAKTVFEPKTPSFAARFEAMEKLAERGIITGTVFMPILPFIYDDDRNIEAVVRKTKECGGQYVLEAGLSLFGYCKKHFYKALERYDPVLIAEYDKLYATPDLLAQQGRKIHDSVVKYCQRFELTPYIPRPVEIYSKELQINKRIAERFYLEARELQLLGQDGHREWAYRKAAWAIDDLKEGIERIFQERGIEGLLEIKAVGKGLAKHIIDYLKTVDGM
jgi:DNA repair photolyase